MARMPLSQTDDWELVYDGQDIRGQQLVDERGQSIGTVREMIVDTDDERVDAIVLDNGREIPAAAFIIRDGRPVLAARTPARAPEPTDKDTIEVRAEELMVRKRPVQTGEVSIKKEVVTEQRTMDVPVTREEVTVERHKVEPRPADEPIGSDQETIRIPIAEEHVTVEKRPVVTEELTVGKRAVEETQEVSGTVRHEEVVVNREGDVAAFASWDEAKPHLRNYWQERHGKTGGRWEDDEPHYRFAWDMYSRPEYRRRSWAENEPEFRRSWEGQHHGMAWSQSREHIRGGWDRLASAPARR